MYKPVSTFVGLRYLKSPRSFVSFVSAVAIGGLALSVAVLIAVLSVVNGFDRELQQRVFRVLPHTVLLARTPTELDAEAVVSAAGTPGVVGVAPFVQGAALAAHDDEVAGVLLTGIEPASYADVSDVADFVDGETLEAGTFGVWLGGRLADKLGLGLGDRVNLILPDAAVTPVGVFPRQKRFRIVGLLRSGSELDGRGAYVHLLDAQRLFRLRGQVHGLHVRTADLFAAEDIGSEAIAALASLNFVQRSWMRSHGNLYRAIALQRSTMFVLLSLLVALAAFNLVSTLVMVVNERRSDVSVMRSMGSNTATVVGVFLVLGISIGVIGILLGVLAGVGLAHGLESGFAALSERFNLDLMSQYFVDYLPVEVRSADVLQVSIVAFALCVLSALYPAWSASRLQPSTVLRYE